MAGLLLSAPGSAAASCPAPADLTRALQEAPSVFVGEVLSTGEDTGVASVRVTSVWKGDDLPARVDVHGAVAGSRSETRFETGVTYLFVPENSRAPFLASDCSATRPYEANGTVIPAAYQDAVGSTTARHPIASSAAADRAESNALRTATLGIVSAAVIGAGLLMMRLRQPDLERTALAETAHHDGAGPMKKTSAPSTSARKRMRRLKRRARKL